MKDVSAEYTVTATDICTGQLIQVTFCEPVMRESSANVQLQIDDDRFPAIAGRQISGEAFPGRELQARGYSINGTTRCNFEWARHLEDGSVDYIDGAPKYLVTADDVNTEVQALDDKKRKGENVKLFTNERRKICSDPELQDFTERTLYNGPASYRISKSTGYLGIWEPAALAIKGEGYSTKCSGSSGVVVSEKFSPSTTLQSDDDPLPAIAGLQISGEAFPGGELQARGYSINGTTCCNFEWVRHLEDGSVDYIKGAQQPNYLVTADDVNTYLAIEIQPLDDRKRKGEIVKVFANERRKIVCDPEMQNHIERTLYNGHASYRISVSTGYLGIWEPATLTIKREGYSIKCNGSCGGVVSQTFSPNTTVAIPYGQPTEFFISSSSNSQQILRADNSMDSNSSRDAIVLTLRLFIVRAGEKKKEKKRCLFFCK